MFHLSDVFAFWLFTHPETKVFDWRRGKEVIFWYSPKDACFMCQTPSNRVYNKPMKARGLCSSYLRYCRNLDPGFSFLSEKDLFDMS